MRQSGMKGMTIDLAAVVVGCQRLGAEEVGASKEITAAHACSAKGTRTSPLRRAGTFLSSSSPAAGNLTEQEHVHKCKYTVDGWTGGVLDGRGWRCDGSGGGNRMEKKEVETLTAN
jgi:hypothetical protein